MNVSVASYTGMMSIDIDRLPHDCAEHCEGRETGAAVNDLMSYRSLHSTSHQKDQFTVYRHPFHADVSV
jgi:hypothetical protein